MMQGLSPIPEGLLLRSSLIITIPTALSRDYKKTREIQPLNDEREAAGTERSKPGPFLAAALEAARLGGSILAEIGCPQNIRAKAPRDLVTEADLAAQQVIQQHLAERFPDHSQIGEEQVEGDSRNPRADYVWAVDPLDGTTNFVHGLPFYCVSVALMHRGLPIVGVILDPVRGECFSAERNGGAWLNDQPIRSSPVIHPGEALMACSFAAEVRETADEVKDFLRMLPQAQSLRRTGSSALNLAYVAAGRLDAFWSSTTQVWDVAAGIILVTEAGGYARCLSGAESRPLTDPRILATATEKLSERMLKIFDAPE